MKDVMYTDHQISCSEVAREEQGKGILLCPYKIIWGKNQDTSILR